MTNKKYYIFLIIILNSLLLGTTPPQPNIPNIIEEKTPLEKKKPKQNQFNATLTKLNETLNQKNYLLASQLIQELSLRIRIEQKNQIESLFPDQIENYTSNTNHSTQLDLNTVNYGMLLTKSYTTPNKAQCNINIIYLDPSIDEYINIIKTPSLIEGLDHTKIIKIQNKFHSIEKISLNENFYEYNIIINKNVLINMIFNGIKDKSIINLFFEKINFNKINTLLR